MTRLGEAEWATALLCRAAEAARAAAGRVEPNPLVGAIALENGEPVGQGIHEYWGGPHAEENALLDARRQGRKPDAMVVTLEPCSSKGGNKKRGPCTQLLLDAGIRELVLGSLDPDPRHAGAGIEQLRAAGVLVHGPFEIPQVQNLLRRFHCGLSRKRPWVVLKWAMTLDGKTGTRTGSSRWISGKPARVWAHQMRAECDAVMVGPGTLVADDPELTVRHVEGPQALRIALDPEGLLTPEYRLLQSLDKAPLLVLRGEDGASSLPSEVEQEFLPTLASAVGSHRTLDMGAALELLWKRGIRRLLVEGGGGLAAQLVEAGLFDAVAVVVAPKLAGGRWARTGLAGLGVADMAESLPLEDLRCGQLGEDLLLEAFRHEDEAEAGA
ncbi:MAG: riboflavin biosynthesis protein RibD [Planctomycetota bacterium]|nr:MAG: riboflavin biosynthesis protein RibD [Planctomycetota bacterium]